MIKNRIVDIFLKCRQVEDLNIFAGQNKNVSILRAHGSARAFIVFALLKKSRRNILCVFADIDEGKVFYDDLASMDENSVKFFPPHLKANWTETGPQNTTIGQRIDTIKSLGKGPVTVVTSVHALAEKVADPQIVKSEKLAVRTGQTYEFSNIVKKLGYMGYVREERVDRPGEMSVRGGIIDLFLFEGIHPYRIEFFADKVESIRQFDVETQRSIRNISAIDILHAGSAGPYLPYDEHPIDQLDFSHKINDYFIDPPILVLFDKMVILNEMDRFYGHMDVQSKDFLKTHGIQNFTMDQYYLKTGELSQILDLYLNIDFSILSQPFSFVVDFNIIQCDYFNGDLQKFRQKLVEQKKQLPDTRAFLCCDSKMQQKRMIDLLEKEGFPDFLKIEAFDVSGGFLWPEFNLYVYTNRELYNRKRLPKSDKIENRSVSLHFLSSLKMDDYVVHIDFGIGIYKGLKKIRAYGKERECLIIEYQDNDLLYVPLEKMDRVQKYSSREGAIPQLSKLGSSRWETTKKNTKKKVKEIARQLVKLYAIRKMKKGHAFPPDNIWQKELEASFCFEETVDQLSAIEDIKKDMQAPKPMDRLVCGDVGYGKTEVAIRAAFKAINDSKQVAVLVPTTILAQQHFETFQDRLKPFPVQIDFLSRFKSTAGAKKIVQQLAKGQIDLIVGTHRLLSKDIEFKNLGLLIVDEEQKFGVLHKEKLKMLKNTVDTLTLSATPIPRTMHMSLISAKDMSLINTPPHNRLPIKTEVSRFDPDLIRTAILKEVDRNGQVFFVHNRVQSIYAIAETVKEYVPEVTVGIAHGQMDAKQLDKAMHAFARGDIQVLVCTMIIESGIDLPNVNTLIVNHAERLGLSQLYQLRGRVGRSVQQAYAYLLIPPMKRLTRTAIKRLQTIQELTQLGSGYKVAMRDLEIRGAGNIFGARQSGYVDALGYELYTKIINEAITELKTEMKQPGTVVMDKEDFEPQVEFKVDAYLPESFIFSAPERVDIYHRLIEAQSEKAVSELKSEIMDRFGKLPKAAEFLFDYVFLKLYCKMARVSKLALYDGKIVGKFAQEFIPKGEHFRPWLGKIVEKAKDDFHLRQEKNDLYFELDVHAEKSAVQTAKKFLQSIV